MISHRLGMPNQIDNPFILDLHGFFDEFLQFLEVGHDTIFIYSSILKHLKRRRMDNYLMGIIRPQYLHNSHHKSQYDQNYKQVDMMNDDSSLPVELYFAGRNLKDLDFFSKSDPFIKFSVQRSFHGNLQMAGRTETCMNTVNPNWKEKINVQYFFEMKQPVRIEVYDEDSSKNADFIGKVETSMGNIMGSYQQTVILEIKDHQGKATGKVIVRAEKVENSSHSMRMNWRGGKIANVDSMFDFWDKSDPYLKFLKLRQDNTFLEAARTQVIHNNQSPNWKPMEIPVSKLVLPTNPNPSFKVQCWDHEDKDTKHQFIGQTYVSMADLKNKPCPQEFTMTNPKIKKPGKLILEQFQMVPTPNFIDYLKSGLQMNLVVAIDFTGSNGSPTSPNSLHYMGNQPNQYQQVIKGIWDIIESYDSDKKIPTFGFGAKPHFPRINSNTVSHCFPINDNPQDPQIHGFDNLMSSYVNAISHLELAGPTYFAPILQQAFTVAKGLTQSYSYQILLILTDGEIHDMAATKQIIVANANLPLSIIIVGVGNADFQAMIELDGDGNGLYSPKGQKCPRDIVQFVPYRNFNGNPQLLTSELLREIPTQVTQYFRTIGRLPAPMHQQSMEEMMPSNSGQSMGEAILKNNSKG